MAGHFTYHRRVEFSETDMAGIVHFARFFRYMESAEHALWRSMGLSVHGEYEGRMIGWPRVSATCDYIKPLRFEDELEIDITVSDLADKSAVFEHVFRKAGGDEVIARGRMKVVCATMDVQGGRMRATTIPHTIAARLAALSNDDQQKETV